MKESLSSFSRLQHIYSAIEDIEKFHAESNFISLEEDYKLRLVIVRLLEIIGEAVNHLPKELLEKYPEIEWRDIIAFRNIIVHEYFGVDAKILDNIIMEKLPLLKKVIALMLKEFE